MNLKSLVMTSGVAFLTSCTAQTSSGENTTMYPETKKTDVVDVYFGQNVADPYRWLEDDMATDTQAWVQSQAAYTDRYLSKIPFRQDIKNQLKEIWNYERVGAPYKEGDYTYFSKNDGLQAQSVIYRTDKDGKTEVFLDPNTFSKDGTTSLAGLSFNKSGKLAAYSISEGGSDWNKIIILDVDKNQVIDQTIQDVKFSGASWLGEEGFFYSSYDKPEGSALSAKTDTHKVYFHKLGTDQKNDELIIGGEDFKRRYMNVGVSDDQQYLILSAANATNGNELYIKKIGSKSDFTPIQTGYDYNTNFIDSKGDTLYLLTDKGAPNQRVVTANINTPTKWTDLIKETSDVLGISTGGGNLFASYIKDAVSVVKQYDYTGKLIREITLPGKGSAGGFYGKAEDKDLYYSFSNYITPGTTYKFNVASGKSEVYYKPNVKFDADNYVSEQVFYTSKDGTKVPMIISYKKGLKMDGKNPTILYGYGGFNVSLTPGFSVVNAVWMDNGGVYAVPNIRGGGEYGKKWHDAGTKLQKKNVFNDFIAAGEYLQSKGYTSKDYMAISGGSNGGLLVGATMTMRPDLAKVALPAVGVLDMLRYNKFTAGAGWAYDYGTAEDSKEMFEYLKSYSPLHNVAENACYPSTMITTGDHDDRVVPAHSFKFGAELQAKQGCDKPILLRIETNGGHGAGRSTDQMINENADKLSFTLSEMGITTLDH
ncbi:prolyl oligopeptidase family serine peptidase [Chryseobacterium sp. A321]